MGCCGSVGGNKQEIFYVYLCFRQPVIYIDPDGREAALSGSAAQQAFRNFRSSMPPDDYIDKMTGKHLGSDGASTNNIRSIDRRDFAEIKTTNNGTTSSEATKQLQAVSNEVTINDFQIQGELQAVSDLSRKVEHQTFIVYNRQESSVSAIRGEFGTDGKVTIPETKTYTYNDVVVDNLINLGGKNYILLAQAHGHNLTTELGKTNAPGTSSDYDKPTAIYKTINVYAIDAYNTKVGGQASIHRVTAIGIQTNFIGKTIGADGKGTGKVNIGLESLKAWAGRK